MTGSRIGMKGVTEPRPYVWWLRVRNDPDCPDSFELRGNGTMIGRWRHGDGSVAYVLTEERMRRYGWEKCFCDPTEHGAIADGCPAHALAGI